MMKLQTYAGFSVMAALAVIFHAFNSRGQFYPALVYLSTSKISLVLLLNMGLVGMCIMWQLTKKIFLGTLREAEVERLNEQSWREVMEILFAITIFRQDFSVTFLAMVTALLLIKSLHWLAQKRVEHIETTPSVPKLSHIRIASFMGFLLVIDSIFMYMVLVITTVSTFIKYMFHVRDTLMEGQWEKKAVYTFYLELIRDLVHLTLCMCFFFIIFLNYGVPLHLMRELYETFRNFKIRVSDYIRYRKITSNMNDRFPDATPEELEATDATCIICREEMTVAKKLVCGHLFHVHCLRSCRTGTIPAETSSQGSNANAAANDNNISQHQARLKAAASAASLYEKSFVYPSPNALTWTHEHALIPQTFINGQFGEGNASGSQLDLQMKLIKHQIEFLQNQSQLLQTSNGKKPIDIESSDITGKSTSTPSSSVVDSSDI
ncbi:erad-associated E3 ubiquitin-protein ligase hrd1a [Phtheirospermum japonicum]|uniref:Erad-associated E3 ubiquitin-protein ligase hrd1a n=1 Tax=Phtheirospermum japonicum TaxID=374723 RepID=A0A830D4I0_9LAMI|nr:erad-associated E3 ubiquitin-protein ligase hrd1a [Phtheirospermum japonicum]